MSIEISSLSGKKQQIASACDSKSNGGNGDGVINGNEMNIFTSAVKTMTDSGFTIKGKTFSFEGASNTISNASPSIFNFSGLTGSNKSSNANSGGLMPASTKESSDTKSDGVKYNSGNTKIGSANGFSDKYDDKISKYADKYNVDPNLVKAIMRAESSFNPNATSSCNCQGLMQVNPKYNKGNLYDVDTNINAGCKILSQCLDAFNGDVSKALMGYNQGIGGANNSIKNGKNSSSYSQKVLQYYNQLSNKKLNLNG